MKETTLAEILEEAKDFGRLLNKMGSRKSKHVVNLSGGVASAVEAKLVALTYGIENTLMLFADTLIEDEDLYRFSAGGTK